MKRLFFALWPDADTRQKIEDINASIALAGVRKLKPSNLHVTLVFLGNIEDAMRADIVAQVTQIQSPCFALQFDGIAHWHTPKTICLTASAQPRALHHLVEQLQMLLRAYPIFLHDRPYRAHVTLMRKAKQDFVLEYPPIHWRAYDFVLVESVSTAEGIVYQVLEKWPLFGD